MTTFIPSLTLPAAVFASPAYSILLPIALGTAVGFTVQRTSPPSQARMTLRWPSGSHCRGGRPFSPSLTLTIPLTSPPQRAKPNPTTSP
jgi:hypothetical protein